MRGLVSTRDPVAQNERQKAADNGALAGAADVNRHERLTRLVLRRSKLSDEEGALLREVFPEILATHHDLVWNRLKRRCLELCDAEDLQQEVFLELHSYILEHGFPDNLPGMLHALTEGKLLNYLRAQKRAPLSVALPSSGSEKPRSGPDVDHAIDRRDVALRIFSQLSPEHQAVIEKVVLNGLTHSDAADVLNLPEGTVKSRLIAAKRTLLALAEPVLPSSQRGLP